jgi:hypothetical protein
MSSRRLAVSVVEPKPGTSKKLVWFGSEAEPNLFCCFGGPAHLGGDAGIQNLVISPRFKSEFFLIGFFSKFVISSSYFVILSGAKNLVLFFQKGCFASLSMTDKFGMTLRLLLIPLPPFSLFVKPHVAGKGDWRKRS